MPTEQNAAAEATQKSTTWKIDPAHTVAEFAVKHMMFATVKGTFKDVQGTIHANGEGFADVDVRADIDAASVETGAADRDAHLRGADFFDVENHPTLTFESTRVEKVRDEKYRVVGDLTIRGTTREVTLDVDVLGQGKDPWGQTRVGAVATTTINRKQYGLTWNQALEAGGFLVGDEIKVTLHVQAVQQ